MNNTILKGVLTDITALSRATNYHGQEQISLPVTMVTTQTKEQHDSVERIYHTSHGIECVSLTDDTNGKKDARFTDAPSLSSAIANQIRITKESMAKQKRGRFLVWPVRPKQSTDFTSSVLCWP